MFPHRHFNTSENIRACSGRYMTFDAIWIMVASMLAGQENMPRLLRTAARVAVLALSLAFNVQFRFCPGFVYSQTPAFPTLIL
jgi:hypothetical protein